MGRYIVGITGASGSIYGKNTAEELLKAGNTVHLVASRMGRRVFEYELGRSYAQWERELQDTYGERFCPEDDEDLFAGIASGSFGCSGMIIAPCSMSTLGELAAGITPTLMKRAADVMLKQHRKLVLVPRETPLSVLHLENMLRLSRAGACILPAMPAFYHRPEKISDLTSFLTGKILDCLEIENHLFPHWKEESLQNEVKL